MNQPLAWGARNSCDCPPPAAIGPRIGWVRRWLGRGFIALIWVVLAGIILFCGAMYAVYADLKSPARSHLTAGTRWEGLPAVPYASHFVPIWQANTDLAQFDPELIYVPKPGTARFRGPEFDTTITITAEGLRRQPAIAGESGLLVCVGDSFTLGWGVDDLQTFPAILQELNGRRTINAGVSLYGTARELLRLRRLGLIEKAAGFVIQYCANDAPENREFVRRHGKLDTGRPSIDKWSEIIRYRPLRLSYLGTLGAITRYS